jgi:hypothetical protein
MPASVAIELPPFDTGQYEGCELKMTQGNAVLTLHVTDLSSLAIRFSRVRWHQFTALPNCTEEMVGDAYFRVVEYPNSPAVADFIRQDRASRKAYTTLCHYRIFLDETGCHEFFAESTAAL